MLKDRLTTPEEKRAKQKRIEENRRVRLMKMNDGTSSEGSEIMAITTDESTTSETNTDELIRAKMSKKSSFELSDADRACLSHIQNSYLGAIKLTPSASSTISFDPSVTKVFSFSTTMEIDTFSAVKLINFLRLIPDFESLDEEDRLSLVKNNLVLLLVLRDLLVFDRRTEILYDDNPEDTTPLVREKFAHCYRSLYTLFYGYEETQFYMSNLCRIFDSLDNDPLVIQLLMIISIFQIGISINGEQIRELVHREKVFNAHAKYVDLLFRYLIEQFSFDVAAMKMLRLVESMFRVQTNARRYREMVKERKDDHFTNPLLNSVLGIV